MAEAEAEEREEARRGWFEEEEEAATPLLSCSQLTAETLMPLVRKAKAWRSRMEGSVVSACTIVLPAAWRVAASRTTLTNVENDSAATIMDVLRATRHDPAVFGATERASTFIVGAILNAVATVDLLVDATHAYLLAMLPQPFIRSIDHQMDRCSGTNISK